MIFLIVIFAETVANQKANAMGGHFKWFLLFLLFVVKVKGDSLILCSDNNVESMQLCKKSNSYRSNVGPEQPTFYDLIIDLKNILEVDHDKNTMTAYVYIITQWNDSRLNFAYPNGTSEKES